MKAASPLSCSVPDLFLCGSYSVACTPPFLLVLSNAGPLKQLLTFLVWTFPSIPFTICDHYTTCFLHKSCLTSFNTTLLPLFYPNVLLSACLDNISMAQRRTHPLYLYFPANERGAPAVVGDIISVRHKSIYGSVIFFFSAIWWLERMLFLPGIAQIVAFLTVYTIIMQRCAIVNVPPNRVHHAH